MSTAALLLVDGGGGGLGLILLVVVVVIASIEICLLFFRMAKEHSVRIALNNEEAIRAHDVPVIRVLVVAIYAHWGHLGELFLQLCFNVFFHECRHAK